MGRFVPVVADLYHLALALGLGGDHETVVDVAVVGESEFDAPACDGVRGLGVHSLQSLDERLLYESPLGGLGRLRGSPVNENQVFVGHGGWGPYFRNSVSTRTPCLMNSEI